MQGSVGHLDLPCYGVYTTCCLTQIRIISSRSLLITAGTDGFVALWSIPVTMAVEHTIPTSSTIRAGDFTPLELMSRHKVHQSTIKSMAVLSSSPSIILVTSGDDNALALTRIETTEKELAQHKYSTLLIPSAHASAVNAVQALDESDSLDNQGKVPMQSVFTFMTTGNDQRVKRWLLRAELDKPGVEGFYLKRVFNKTSSVADASCMAMMSSRNTKAVAIAGVGIEVFGI